MNMPALPFPSTPTPGVRRRTERSLPAVRAASGFALVLNEALVRRFGDKLERARREGELCAEHGEWKMSITQLFESVGVDIEQHSKAMVEADAALIRARRDHRAGCQRRDQAAKRLYRELAAFRKSARDLLGPESVRLVPGLEGPTLRDPYALVFQTDLDIAWACDSDRSPAQPVAGISIPWEKLALRLVPWRDETFAAIHAVYRAKAGVDAALEARDNALAAFDKTYNRGSRLLETLLAYLGLPTLAAAVRPHLKVVGRVGRPSKVPPVDAYPDLVERVRAAGLVPAPVVEEVGSAAADAQQRLRRLAVAGVTWLCGLAGFPTQPAAGDGSRRRPRSASRRTTSGWPISARELWRRLRDAA